MRRYRRGVRFGEDPDLEKITRLLVEASNTEDKVRRAYMFALDAAKAYYKRKPENAAAKELVDKLEKAWLHSNVADSVQRACFFASEKTKKVDKGY